MPQTYTPEFKARALQLIEERIQAEQCSGWVACTAVGEALGGISPHTLRNWWKQNRVDHGEAPGVDRGRLGRAATSTQREPRAAPSERNSAQGLGFFRREARPPHDEMIRFIDEHRDQFGVEAICRVLSATECGFITSRAYRAAKTRPASERALRDAVLVEEIRRVHGENYSVYGVRKMHHAMVRAGWQVGRDQMARLMKLAGVEGVRRGRKPITTRPAGEPDARPDLVERRFVTERPHQLWVADITYVRTLAGFRYVSFITDVYSRQIVGWAVAASLHTQGLPLLALEHALLATGTRRGRPGLTHHSDRGSQYVSLAYSDALITAGVTASVGTVGDSYDNALAETVNGLYKAELIHTKRVWESTEAVEFATMGWVHWWNTARLHEALDYRTPVEVEAAYTHDHDVAPVAS